MGTKNDPGQFDCYANALPDEPMFVLLARDPDFCRLVNKWAQKRQHDINCGDRSSSDQEMVLEAFRCARNGAIWRQQNNGKWRK